MGQKTNNSFDRSGMSHGTVSMRGIHPSNTKCHLSASKFVSDARQRRVCKLSNSTLNAVISFFFFVAWSVSVSKHCSLLFFFRFRILFSFMYIHTFARIFVYLPLFFLWWFVSMDFVVVSNVHTVAVLIFSSIMLLLLLSLLLGIIVIFLLLLLFYICIYFFLCAFVAHSLCVHMIQKHAFWKRGWKAHGSSKCWAWTMFMLLLYLSFGTLSCYFHRRRCVIVVRSFVHSLIYLSCIWAFGVGMRCAFFATHQTTIRSQCFFSKWIWTHTMAYRCCVLCVMCFYSFRSLFSMYMSQCVSI